MHDHLHASHPESFPFSEEIKIRKFIKRMFEKLKIIQSADPGKPKSNRRRKPESTKVIWRTKLKEILE